MKVLVIPDVHLKPKMFEVASDLSKENNVDCVVCLMDIADDWDKQMNITLYEETYDAAIRFAKQHPNSLWCYGNHDISYLLGALESGYSFYAEAMVRSKVGEMERLLCKDNRLAFIHKIDNVLFMHGGLTDYYVRQHAKSKDYNDVAAVVKAINDLPMRELWRDDSPIWSRPQMGWMKMYKPRKLLQVVGHTPVKEITKEGNLISCDTFSTYSNGEPVGTEEFLLLDTEAWEWRGV